MEELMKKVITSSGLVLYDPVEPMTIRFDRKETEELLGKISWEDADDHCEIAHIELTSKCTRSCTYCYNPKDSDELGIDHFLDILEQLAQYGVFQITFGGGDPFCEWNKLNVLAPYAKSLGLNVCLTTNGDILYSQDSKTLEPVLESVGQINLSYHGDDSFYQNLFLGLQPKQREFGFKVGINFCCRNEYLMELERIAQVCEQKQHELILLVYKPVKDNTHHMTPHQVFLHSLQLSEKYDIRIGIDGACAARCMASRRFVDIHPNGDASLCSFKREPIGNLLVLDFDTIWAMRPRAVQCPYFEITNKVEEYGCV
jgi:MoaA/NifB/PqqE/SkfB family radical SAM enzyme